MASLLAKCSWRSKKELDANSETVEEPSNRRSSSIRSYKTTSSVFNRQDSPLRPDCQERTHYPLYDPSNPEHDGLLASCATSSHASYTTPKKSRLQSIVQSLQDALRAKANYFHVQRTPDQPIPSPSSSVSKKSVRFREGHFVIEDEGKPTASPFEMPPQNSSPQLPKLNFTQTPLLSVCPPRPYIQENAVNRASREIYPAVLLPPFTTLEDPFDDIHTTEDLENRKTPDEQISVHKEVQDYVVTGSDESNRSRGSHSPQCEHDEDAASNTLIAKSNSLPLRKSRVEIGEAEVFGVAAVPSEQEDVPAVSKREDTSEGD